MIHAGRIWNGAAWVSDTRPLCCWPNQAAIGNDGCGHMLGARLIPNELSVDVRSHGIIRMEEYPMAEDRASGFLHQPRSALKYNLNSIPDC